MSNQNNPLKPEFRIDRSNNTVTVVKEFAAPRQEVWDYHTRAELLNLWWAPRPLTTKTQSMDFRNGGHWIYCMVDPEGKEYWGRIDYISINPGEGYSARDVFADENGVENPDMPAATWDVSFTEKNGHTVVTTVATYTTAEGLEQVIAMGMQEGFTATISYLDELLAKNRM